MSESHRQILILATQIVAAQVRHNDVAAAALPSLIHSVYNTLADIERLSDDPVAAPSATFHGAPADDHNHSEHIGHAANASVEAHVHPSHGQTVFDDHLICMEDGLSMKMLKRHLLAVHGMTPEEYRKKWGLPEEYPMVAANYARLRSNLALQSGLGLKPDPRSGRSRKGR